MRLSVIGSPRSGKTTLFTALSGIAATTGQNRPAVAVIEVPDERVDRLSRIFRPKKTVYSRIEICDTESFHEGDMRNEAVPAGRLREMRLADAFVVVLNRFDDAAGDGSSGFHTLLNEFMIADMLQIEGRIERIKKESGRRGPELEQEKAALEQCLAHLEREPLRTMPLLRSDGKALKGFQFLSQKPLMVVVNCSEDLMKESAQAAAGVRTKLSGEAPVVAACARLEAELAIMGADDRAAFMAEYGIAEPLKGSIIRLAYETLGLVSFLTVGEDECRAWAIRRGMTTQEAAGTIHTDLAERFIRAETVAYDDFIAYGDFPACKKAGVWRLEGKQYVVKDGDIISIRAGA
ncbi:MAG: DUF933 domain-containing protein [Syntrophorhabdales bacterium]|jgi:hypothetical protein